MPVDEVLYGAEAIAKALGLPRRAVYHHAEKGRLPCFKVGAKLCAKRSALAAWFARCDAPAIDVCSTVMPASGALSAA